MKNKRINGELKELMNQKGSVCLSVILPLNAQPSKQEIDQINISHVFEKAEKLLLARVKKPAALQKKLNELRGKIKLGNGAGGLGVFVSDNLARIVYFPFEVSERIVLGGSFETRDVLYKQLAARMYLVLSLSLDEVRLYKGYGSIIEEVKDKKFPAAYSDTYEYSKPSRGHSHGYALKGFEKDKSAINGIRLQSFYHVLDQRLNDYLDAGTPLILTGVKKDLGYFEKVTKHHSNIIGKAAGNFHGDLGKLSARAAGIMRRYEEKEQRKLLASARELVGNGLLTSGIREVWKDAKTGKGRILLVEKDFMKPAFTGKDEFRLLLRPPQGKHQVITDAVDDVIETVMEKNGEVVFVDNGQLRDFDSIALINRYQ